MGHKKNSFCPHIHRHINSFAYIIAAFDIFFKRQVHMLPEVVCPVISRRYKKVFHPFRSLLGHFHADTLNKSRLAHRFYDPGCSKDGNPSLDAKSWIECFLRDFFSFRNEDRNFHPAFIMVFIRRLLCRFQNHGLRNRIDRRLADFLGKSPFRYPAHSYAALKNNLWRNLRKLHISV